MQHVRTKWHKILPLILKGEVYLPGRTGAIQVSALEKDMNFAKLTAFLTMAETLPHFVIDRELSSISTKQEYQQSLLDMKRAGVLRLPFPAMVVEYPSAADSRRQHVCILRDLQHEVALPWEDHAVVAFRKERPLTDFYGIRLTVESDIQGEYLTASPSIVFVGIHSKPEVDEKTYGKIAEEHRDATGAWVHLAAYGSGLVLDYNDETEKFVEASYRYDAGPIFHAAASALLLMTTKGVKQEVIETEKINRKRGGPSKPHIPRHTYISIGRVYVNGSSDKSVEYHPHKSPRPHWRRGHIRMQPHGVGRASVKQVYINPRLIAYHGEHEPTKPDYVVTK